MGQKGPKTCVLTKSNCSLVLSEFTAMISVRHRGHLGKSWFPILRPHSTQKDACPHGNNLHLGFIPPKHITQLSSSISSSIMLLFHSRENVVILGNF